MAGVPSPLQIGSPLSERKPSTDAVPSALRAGSPATERANAPWDSRPPLVRKNTSGSNRLSQLFPSRPSSISSISPPVTTPASRRTSYPSPLVPAAESRRTSWGPAPPPPPSFPEATAYEPSATPFENQGASASLQSRSGTKKLFSRLTSLRGSSNRSGSYNRINDDESYFGRRHLRGVEEDDESIDPLQAGTHAVQMSQMDQQQKMRGTASVAEQQRDLNEAGYAAEYERLERQLGAGMSSITERPFTFTPASIGPGSYSRQPRGLPNTATSASQAQDAQEEAEKTGGIVAVAEVPVDISDSFGGGDFEARSMINASSRPGNDGAQKSYFFPKG